MPHLKIGGAIILSMLFVTAHFYYAHLLKDQYPPDLLIGILIGWVLGIAIITKTIKLK